MQAPQHVYELDTDALMAELQRALEERGYEVIERAPAGVWWLTTVHDSSTAAGEVAEIVKRLIAERMQEVEQ
ncbi:MAG: hypothetical protein M3Z66_15590 [Chloroflexota bacterium]|nr:hypothetical protein [Chloroflexota bacterium]